MRVMVEKETTPVNPLCKSKPCSTLLVCAWYPESVARLLAHHLRLEYQGSIYLRDDLARTPMEGVSGFLGFRT